MENANNILFRCSSLGKLMTNDKSGKAMGDTAKKHLLEVYALEKYSRFKEIKSKYLDKGNEREEDAITLVSRIERVLYKKNIHRIENEFIKGMPDLFQGETIRNADKTNDTKCSWDIHTFLEAQKKLDPDYYWQGTGYMILTGAKEHTVSYCLVNGTEKAINDEKRKLAYSMGIIDERTPEYIEKCKQIEINHIFDLFSFKTEYPHFDFDNDLSEWKYDIPMKDRLFQFKFERNEEDIQRLYDRIKEARVWMNENLFKA